MPYTLKTLLKILIILSLMGCTEDEYINMEDVYIESGKAYLTKDNSLINGKVMSLGDYKKPGVLAIFYGRKTNYEGFYAEGLKDYKWSNLNPDKSLQEAKGYYVSMVKEIWDSGELLKVEYYGSSDKLMEATYFNGTGCPSNPIISTEYLIQNNSELDLILTIDEGVQRNVLQDKTFLVGKSDQCNIQVIPSENDIFQSIRVYKGDSRNNLVLLYTHQPILDSMWIMSKTSNNNFQYTLEINDELLNGSL